MIGRYLAGLFLTVIFLVFICLASGFGLNVILSIDVPSAIVVIVFPLLFMGVFYGWKNTGTAFSVLSRKDANKEILINAKTFFENYGKTIFSISFIAFIVSFIAIMKDNEDYGALGPNMAIALTLLFYAGIINMVIIIPYKILIKRKLIMMP